MTDEVLNTKLDHIRDDLVEVKHDLREIKDGAPLHRIQALEAWKAGVTRFLVAVALLIVGAYVTVLFR